MELVKGAGQHEAAPYLPDVTTDALRRAAVPALRQSSRLAFLNIKNQCASWRME
jgi:hypothetical protein